MSAPTILINNSTGSDSAASGAGPSTALTGTAAATSGTGLVITLDGSPDLTNVLTDGTHVIWVLTSSGRQYAAITAKDNSAKTVTTTTAYTASLTGKTWAIGGKRATLNNANTRTLFSADIGANWLVDLQETGTDYTLTSTLTFLSGLACTIYSSSVNRPKITTSTNSVNLFTFNLTVWLILKHISFSNTATTRGIGLYPLSNNAPFVTVMDCVFDGFTRAIDGSFVIGFAFPNLSLVNSEFKNCSSNAVANGNAQQTIVEECFFHDNADAIFLVTVIRISRSVFARNLKIVSATIADFFCKSTIISGSTTTSAAIDVTCTRATIVGNIFYGNAGTAINLVASSIVNDYNAYGANATADRQTFSASGTDVALTADPFTDSTTNDFKLNGTTGGGALLKGGRSLIVAPGLLNTSYFDIGPSQLQNSGSSGPTYYSH